MIKNILTVAIVVALSACSSSDSGDDNDTTNTPTNTTGDTVTPVTGPTGGGEAPATDTKAGTYFGDFGGAQGVYVINNDFQLAGLAIAADGSAQSLFGDLDAGDTFTGSLRQYAHQESRPAGVGDSFGAVAVLADPLEIDVTIANGQNITSTAESPVSVSLLGAEGSTLTPATAASLAGTWSGVHGFCDDEAATINCQLLTTTMTFEGTQVTGSTVITDSAGVAGEPILLAGGITEFGAAALIDFTWGDAPGYSGLVFFTAADGRLAFVGENQTAGPVTISAVLSQ